MLYNEIIQKLEKLTTSKANPNVYIVSSIDGNGVYIGRIKDILLDSSDDIVIETDVDKVNIVRGDLKDRNSEDETILSEISKRLKNEVVN